ncbi:putative defense protein 3 [Petromyzon marinus]|uniref:putative defense protein 3 n=1 Tax=Petromyzon marinus TaxID=7757 RepID=UPI003F6FD16A
MSPGVLWALLLAQLCLAPGARAFPGGAPSSSCVAMRPMHDGVRSQTSQAPYVITAVATNGSIGVPFTVRVMGPVYRGLLLQARTPGGATRPMGTWQGLPRDTRLLQCDGRDASAVTHSNINEKINQTFTWMPPAGGLTGPIMFIAAVAESREVYWMDIRSSVLNGGLSIQSGASLTWLTASGSLLCASALRL